MTSIIDRYGFHILKKDLTPEELEEIKKDLSVSPKNDMYDTNNIIYEQFTETENEIIIPRFYGTKKFKKNLNYQEIFNPQQVEIPFNSKLRDYQVPIIETCISYIKKHGGGHLSVPCGRGKTVMAIYIAHMLGLKTLVLTHQSFLQDQWADRAYFFTGQKVGIIRQDKVDVEGKNIVVAMIHSIASRNYGDIFDQFGLVICDECHHYASKWFSNAISKLGAKYTLGLSATLYRNDGLIRVVHWYLGGVAYKEQTKTNNQVAVKFLNFQSKDLHFKEFSKKVKGKIVPDCTKMTNFLVEVNTRDNVIINVINTLRKDPNRKILVLSGRKSSHLPNLKNAVDKLIQNDVDAGLLIKDEYNTYYYTGDCKPKERFEAEKNADIIFATYHMAQEGLDIPRLNTVILATPKKDVVQAVGRILRKELENGDVRPLIVDIIDELSIFIGQSKIREKFYELSKYILNYHYLMEDKFISVNDYINLQNKDNDNSSDADDEQEKIIINTNVNIKFLDTYEKVLAIPPVEFIIDP